MALKAGDYILPSYPCPCTKCKQTRTPVEGTLLKTVLSAIIAWAGSLKI